LAKNRIEIDRKSKFGNRNITKVSINVWLIMMKLMIWAAGHSFTASRFTAVWIVCTEQRIQTTTKITFRQNMATRHPRSYTVSSSCLQNVLCGSSFDFQVHRIVPQINTNGVCKSSFQLRIID